LCIWITFCVVFGYTQSGFAKVLHCRRRDDCSVQQHCYSVWCDARSDWSVEVTWYNCRWTLCRAFQDRGILKSRDVRLNGRVFSQMQSFVPITSRSFSRPCSDVTPKFTNAPNLTCTSCPALLPEHFSYSVSFSLLLLSLCVVIYRCLAPKMCSLFSYMQHFSTYSSGSPFFPVTRECQTL
jgi:hypothetical protein